MGPRTRQIIKRHIVSIQCRLRASSLPDFIIVLQGRGQVVLCLLTLGIFLLAFLGVAKRRRLDVPTGDKEKDLLTSST